MIYEISAQLSDDLARVHDAMKQLLQEETGVDGTLNVSTIEVDASELAEWVSILSRVP